MPDLYPCTPVSLYPCNLVVCSCRGELGDTDSLSSPPKKRGRGRPPAGSGRSGAESDGGTTGGSSPRSEKLMRKCVEILIKYKDSDGRILSDPFVQLPTKKELPDYYEVDCIFERFYTLLLLHLIDLYSSLLYSYLYE